MIKYNPNNWLTLIFHRFTRKTFKQTIPNMVSIVFYSTFFTALYEFYWKEYYSMNPTVHSLLGIVLGLFLVFRTNTAYDKWWEGRKIWGSLVNDCRNLSFKLNAFLRKELKEDREILANLLKGYPIVLRDHLRDKSSIGMVGLPDATFKASEKWNHKPNFIAAELYNNIAALLGRNEISGDQLMVLDKELKGLSDHLGACERIRNTPIPYSYSMYIKKFIFVYSVTLPFGLLSTFGWWTIPVVSSIFYFLVTIEFIAEEIEEPFGLDENDLPTDELCERISDNIDEILLKKGSHSGQ